MKKPEGSDGYSHIVKYTGLFGGVQGLNILVGLVRNKLVAMILGPAGMGLISLFNSTIKLISDSTNLGISMSAVRQVSEAYGRGDEEQVRSAVQVIRSWSLLTALLGMFVCMALSPLLNMWTFTWGDHTLHFFLLSPVIALTAITGGELAILKGIRRLKTLAKISIYNVILLTLITVPVYYYWGQAGIVPSLVIGALVQMCLTIAYSYNFYPLRLKGHAFRLGDGVGMVRLGIAFVSAGILGSGAEFLIRTFLNTEGGLADVGYYNAGLMLTMTYAGVVFASLESDYFPRLSAVGGDRDALNLMVNRQIEVSLLIIAPMLVIFIFGLPILVPLLYSSKFLPTIGMMQAALLAMYMRAVELPIAYIPLAKGDSWSYFFIEAFYDILLVVSVIVGYRHWGLTGVGWAIVLTGVLDVIGIMLYARYKYKYVVSKAACRYLLMQLPFGILASLCVSNFEGWIYWGIGGLLSAGTLLISFYVLRSKSRLWEALLNKIKDKFRHG